MVINHPSNAWNIRLAWFVRLEVLSKLGLSISSGIEEERNLSFHLHQIEVVLVQTYYSQMDYLLTLDNQKVLSM